MQKDNLPVRKLHNLRGKESKDRPRIESQWLPLSKQDQSQAMAEISTKMAKATKKRKADNSLSRKEKKRSIPSMIMMFKGYSMT